jgi:hypothetical protein
VARETTAVAEAVVEEAREKLLVLGQSDKAVADVTGRRNAEFAPQFARAAAFVSNGNYRRGSRDVWLEAGRSTRFCNVELKSPQEGGQARASSDGDDLHRLDIAK